MSIEEEAATQSAANESRWRRRVESLVNAQRNRMSREAVTMLADYVARHGTICAARDRHHRPGVRLGRVKVQLIGGGFPAWQVVRRYGRHHAEHVIDVLPAWSPRYELILAASESGWWPASVVATAEKILDRTGRYDR